MSQDRDALEKFLAASSDDWPAEGTVGVESDWFEAGPWKLHEGPLLVANPVDFDGVVIDTLRAGTYRVRVKGMDFNGHRRISRLQCVRGEADPVALTPGAALGETCVDLGVLTLADHGVLERLIPDISTPERDALSIWLSEYVHGGSLNMLIGTHVVPLGDQTGGGEPDNLPLFVVQSGLGDGGYPVFPLNDTAGNTVGVECEFLPPGFVIP